MSEAIILFCTIFGTIIAYLAYKSSTTGPLKESKTLLLEKLELLQKINSDLLTDLQAYGAKNGSFDSIFMQGLTLRQCVELLSKVKAQILTDESYSAVRNAKSKMRIDEIANNVEIQIKYHSEIRTTIDYFLR